MKAAMRAKALSTLAGFALAVSSCSLPIVTAETIAAAKDASGLTVTTSSKRIVLDWVDDPTVASYRVRFTRNGSVPSDSNGEAIRDVSPPLAIEGLVNGSLHVIILTAAYPDGTEKTLGPVCAIPLAPTTLAPQARGEIGQIRVRWPRIAGAGEYEIQRRAGTSGEFAKLGVVSGDEFVDASALAGTDYYYRVKPASYSEVTSAANPARLALGATKPAVRSQIGCLGVALDVALSGSYAYVSTESSGVAVLDLSDPDSPAALSAAPYDPSLPAWSAGKSISVSGSRLCVAALSKLLIYSLADATMPALTRIVTMQQTPGAANPAVDVEAIGDFAYVACWDSGLQVVSLATGTVIQALDMGGAAGVDDVAICDGYVVTIGRAGNNVVRVYSRNPGNGLLAFVGALSLSSADSDMRLGASGSNLFLGAGQKLYVISLAAPAAPAVLAELDFFPGVSGISVEGSRCYVFSQFNDIVYEYDARDPSRPSLTTTYELPGRPRALASSGSYSFVASDDAGLQVLFDPRYYAVRGGWAKVDAYGSFSGYDLKLRGGLCALVGQSTVGSAAGGLLALIDAADPRAPRVIARLPLPGIGRGVALSGSYAYVADETNGLHVVDLSDPAAPRIASTVSVPGRPSGVAVFGDLAIVTNYTSHVRLIDISDPLAPFLRDDTVRLIDRSDGEIILDGSRAFLTAGTYYGQLQCVDLLRLGDGAASIAAVTTTAAVSGPYAYARDYVDGLTGLHVTNVSDPLRPVKTGVAVSPYLGAVGAPNLGGGVAVSGGYAYAAAWGLGIQRFSVDNPAKPIYLSSYSYETTKDVEVSGSICAVATGANSWQTEYGEGVELWLLEP